jgi:hypothetical protein
LQSFPSAIRQEKNNPKTNSGKRRYIGKAGELVSW